MTSKQPNETSGSRAGTWLVVTALTIMTGVPVVFTVGAFTLCDPLPRARGQGWGVHPKIKAKEADPETRTLANSIRKGDGWARWTKQMSPNAGDFLVHEKAEIAVRDDGVVFTWTRVGGLLNEIRAFEYDVPLKNAYLYAVTEGSIYQRAVAAKTKIRQQVIEKLKE